MSRDKSENKIQTTLLNLARPKMSPKELLKQIRKAHPDASKKDVIRAAFASIIAIADTDIEKAVALQNFALQERGGDEE